MRRREFMTVSVAGACRRFYSALRVGQQQSQPTLVGVLEGASAAATMADRYDAFSRRNARARLTSRE